jgi:hypothetical protein
MGINPMNKITIIIRILFAVTLFQQDAESRIPEGIVEERVEDILPDSETDSALQKAHRAST